MPQLSEERHTIVAVYILRFELLLSQCEEHYTLNQREQTGKRAKHAARKHCKSQEQKAGKCFAKIEIMYAESSQKYCQQAGYATAFARWPCIKHSGLRELIVGVIIALLITAIISAVIHIGIISIGCLAVLCFAVIYLCSAERAVNATFHLICCFERLSATVAFISYHNLIMFVIIIVFYCCYFVSLSIRRSKVKKSCRKNRKIFKIYLFPLFFYFLPHIIRALHSSFLRATMYYSTNLIRGF